MALLDDKTVKEYLNELGFGDIKSFQATYLYPKYVDGVYGQQTENALLTALYVKRHTKNFNAKEFRCECGGKYCCGYPDYMKPELLVNLQTIRDRSGKPITVTCGLRDKTYNSKLGGSIQNSLHLKGQAVDFYQAGTTDTLANRKKAIKWIKVLPNHHYTYGNGCNSYGNSVSAPYMGNALHTDVNTGSVTPDGKLTVDGVGGAATVKALQAFLGVTADGVISGQNKTLAKYYPSLTAVKYGSGGSACVKAMQKWLGITADGIWGQGTSKALQKKLGVTADGIFGTASMKALQKYLNENDKAVYPTATATTAATTTTSASKKKVPSIHLTKTTQQVIDDAAAWASWIAGDNRFHYGHGQAAHKYGCYFCGTEPASKKKAGIVDYEKTYCCNTLVFSAFAHGGCDNYMLQKCQGKKNSNTSVFKDGKHFKSLGKPAFSSLKKGDVLWWDNEKGCHYALYLGNGKLAEAASGDDNVRNSKKWNNSIHVRKITGYGSFTNVSRYIGGVNADMCIRHGEISDRVAVLQTHLGIKADRIFGDGTLKALKEWQAAHGLTSDGIAGALTLAKMEEVA